MRAVSIDAYLTRIGWRGTPSPNFATLSALLDHHMSPALDALALPV
jgi:arylamine N-acetyltransferase